MRQNWLIVDKLTLQIASWKQRIFVPMAHIITIGIFLWTSFKIFQLTGIICCSHLERLFPWRNCFVWAMIGSPYTDFRAAICHCSMTLRSISVIQRSVKSKPLIVSLIRLSIYRLSSYSKTLPKSKRIYIHTQIQSRRGWVSILILIILRQRKIMWSWILYTLYFVQFRRKNQFCS